MLFWYFPIFVCFHSGSSDSNSLNPFFFFSLSFIFFIIIFLYKSLRKESPYLVQFLHYDYGNQFIVFNSYLYKIKLHLQQLVFFNHIYNILLNYIWIFLKKRPDVTRKPCDDMTISKFTMYKLKAY